MIHVLCFYSPTTGEVEAEIVVVADPEHILDIEVELVGIQYDEYQSGQPEYSVMLCSY